MTSQPPPASRDSKPSLSDRWWRLPWAVRIGLVIVIGLAVLAVVGNLRKTGAGTSGDDRQQPPPVVAQQAPALPDGQIAAGVYLVGADVYPGTYRSAGATPQGSSTGYCMWSRHSTASGGPMDDIIASDGARPGQQLIVTIEPGDVLLRTNGCAPWEPIG